MKKSIRFEVSEELHRKVKIKSVVTDTTIADLLRETLRKWVEEDHPIIIAPESLDYSKQVPGAEV